MEQSKGHVEHFVCCVRKRLNRQLGLTVLIVSLTVTGVAMTVIALCYILRGFHVPWKWYPAISTFTLSAGFCIWLFLRRSHGQAVKFVDNHFALKDSVRSYTSFHREHKDSGFYQLQAEQTKNSVTGLSLNAIKYRCPFCLLAFAIVLNLSSVLMGFMPDSPQIRRRMEQEKQILSETAAINLQLKETLEQLLDELDEEEIVQPVDFNDIRERIDQLEDTPDIKDAMRQYAQLEKQINGVLSRLMQRQEEQLLDRMAEQLQQDDATKTLANELSQRDYESASKEMESFQIDPNSALQQQQAKLEQLKTMAARMAEEAEQSQMSRSQQSQSQQAQSDSSDNQNQQDSVQNSDLSGSRLCQLTQQLNLSAGKLGEALQRAMNNQSQSNNSQNGESSQNAAQQAAQNTNQNLNNLGQYLQNLAGKNQAQSMMQQLLSSLIQSQAGLGNMPGSMGNGSQEGGLQAGTGTSNNINTELSGDPTQGELTQLQGIHGSGPSATSVESAGSGSGGSNSADMRDPQEYQQRVESFVQREDVPEAVKAAVKAYFNNIHITEEGN